MTAQARKSKSIWDPAIARRATWDSFVKLNPITLMKNPVMFVVEIGAALLTVELVSHVLNHTHGFGFEFQITVWLWFTVLFANFAEAMAEGRGKAQADTLRKARTETIAYKLRANGTKEEISGSKLRAGDVVVVIAGQFIPGDGEVIEGVASVDESAITGESAPVIRESGGDRSAVTGGTRVPPVTAERSPPDSRITGADSPVMADSSTDATPSATSPSPGINSPAATFTMSPARSFDPAISSIVPFLMRWAMVSARALRSVSAWAFPRPSAMASAKFAKRTVNQSQSVI